MIRTSALPMELGKIPTFSVTQPETLILLQEDTLSKKDFPLKSPDSIPDWNKLENLSCADGVANAESGRLQEVDIQYLEENLTVHQPGGSNIASSSRKQNRVTPDQYDPSQDRSTIRTLSEDRLHVSLRLCSFREPDEPMESIPIAKKRTRATNSSAPLLSSKVDGPSHTNMRERKSPAQAIGVKGRRVNKLNTPHGGRSSKTQ
ncbi:hypothetical protein F2Q69_00005361 [Brassica cretica]|uniref:Uncharacterized protein n=1 Tax=Brassica cretica TaxID=69181 RepID=A0A8S9P9Y0_BRACR|nr:hypothetical protein F2Q69_00005361 [Brassica cretica]